MKNFTKQVVCYNNGDLGGYSSEVPPLPIPNREVKLANADGTAVKCGRVGSRLLKGPVRKYGALFYLSGPGFSLPGVPLRSRRTGPRTKSEACRLLFRRRDRALRIVFLRPVRSAAVRQPERGRAVTPEYRCLATLYADMPQTWAGRVRREQIQQERRAATGYFAAETYLR